MTVRVCPICDIADCATHRPSALPAVPTHSYAGESEASVYDRKGFPPIEIVNDPAAIREAALREAADVLPYGSVYRAIILALIKGETK